MKSRYKQFFFTLIGYFAGNVFTKLISFILLPLYTKIIEPEIYGTFGVITTIVQLVVPMVCMCIWMSVFRYSAEAETEQERYEVISTGLPVMWISSGLIAAVLLAINIFWDLGNPYLVCFYAIANGFQYFYGYIARSMKDNRTFIISGCINSTINLLLNWIGIVYLHHGIETLYYSYIIGTLAQVLIIEIKFRVLSHFRVGYVQKARLQILFKFGGPLALNSIMQWLLTGLTQIMIAQMLGTHYNGLFSVAVKFATLISLIASIFEYAWLELAYDLAKNNNSAGYYRRVINMLFGVLVFGSSILMLAIKILFPYFIASAYNGALEVIPYIVVYASANSLASFFATIYMSYKDVKTITVSSLIAGASNLLLILVLIPAWSFHGAMISLTAACVLMMLIRGIILKKKYQIGIDGLTAVWVLLILAAAAVFYLSESTLGDIGGILVCMVLFAFVARRMFFTYMRPKKFAVEKTNRGNV
ncbi:MAG: oligosaccharide flippase family protein [Hungatella sp.]|nr:oligosaccharide flippase family protein [Hungatella sp.]